MVPRVQNALEVGGEFPVQKLNPVSNILSFPHGEDEVSIQLAAVHVFV